MNIQTLRQAVKPLLPSQVDPAGVPVANMVAACQANLSDTASPNPYPADLQDTAQVNRDLTELATGAQSDFGANALSVRQLGAAVAAAGTNAAQAAEGLAADQKELKHAYFKQVGFTTAWMAATAGTLVVGGLIPTPLSVVAVGGACVMTIRSINKARAKHAELVDKTPALEANLKASRELAAGAGFYAPLVHGWDELLQGSSTKAA